MEYAFSLNRPHRLFSRAISLPAAQAIQHVADHFIPHSRNNYHPYILGSRAMVLYAVLLLAVKVFAVTTLAWGPIVPAESAPITKHTIAQLTNEARHGYNLPRLKESAALAQAAQAKAEHMLAEGYFAHTAPDGKTPWDFMNGSGYRYIVAGENLAVNFSDAKAATNAWMNSPSHRANMLGATYEEMGVGIATGEYHGQTATFVVQMFGTPVEQNIVISNNPTSVLGVDEQLPGAHMAFTEVTADRHGDNMVLTAAVSGDVVKVLARYGQQAVMLNPKQNGVWVGSIPLANLSAAGQTLLVRAFTMDGAVIQQPVASFAPTVEQAFQIGETGQVAGAYTSMFGRTLDIKSAQYKFYGFFLAGLLFSLGLAIGVKRHVQHLNLVANTSLIAFLATFLWMAG